MEVFELIITLIIVHIVYNFNFAKNSQNCLTRFVLVQTRLFNINLMNTGRGAGTAFVNLLVAYNEAFLIDTSKIFCLCYPLYNRPILIIVKLTKELESSSVKALVYWARSTTTFSFWRSLKKSARIWRHVTDKNINLLLRHRTEIKCKLDLTLHVLFTTCLSLFQSLKIDKWTHWSDSIQQMVGLTVKNYAIVQWSN